MQRREYPSLPRSRLVGGGDDCTCIANDTALQSSEHATRTVFDGFNDEKKNLHSDYSSDRWVYINVSTDIVNCTGICT